MGNFKKGFVLLASTGIILIISYYLLFVTLRIPYIGLSVEENEVGKWQISYVDHLGWAEQQGIKVGDTVSLINGVQPSNYSTILQYGVIEQAETLVINKNGEPILHKVTNNMTPQQVQYHIVIPTLVFVILFIFSCVLYLKKSDDKSALILILFFLAIGLSYLSAPVSSRMDTLGIYINRITFSLIPVLFLEFLNNYFIRYGLSLFNRKSLSVLYLANSLLLVITLFFQIFGRNLVIIRYSFLAVFSISILLCFYILLSRYFRYRDTIHKPIFKIIIVGFTLAFSPFVILMGLPSILFGVELIPGALAAVSLVFLPGVFLYLITANRLFDIDFIIDRIRYYAILSLIPTILLVLFLSYLLSEFTLVQCMKLGIVTYIGIIVFLYIKEELDFHFRSKLFREKYNFQASLDRFSQDIAKVMKISDLEERLIMEVTEVLAVKAISLLETNFMDYSLTIKTGSPDFPETVITDWLKNNTELIAVGELIDIGSNGVFLIIGSEKAKSNLVWIRGKLNRTEFNQEERVWLRTIAVYVSMVYENLHLIEGLIEKLEEEVTQRDSAKPWVLRLLFNLSEKERRRLASDLHDSALQQQLLWYRKLEIISVDERIPADLRKQLNTMAEGLLDVTHQIRETCNELLPPLLKETGIVEALKNLFANAQLRTDYVVNFKATGFSIDLDYEHILALYRIVQELLTNAAKHSKATEIKIILADSHGIITLNYRDNGIGMDFENLQSSFNHMGLSGIKERVLSLEGKTCFNSSLGKGFEVSIWMPLDKATSLNEQVV
ncbi:histidine kinase [Desulfosporosinus fructosivorans]|uniref:histidine kinase n=1 Tax=Desulfosporosinus fructosivorans TaxID=2018669 RepID=A0A4Z0R8Z1_9FIRM|nr:ATP-binding protein [Desulfosporosinus fructosivorans]TGE38915.1 histidine kinase [Desulfosporosinus fructosivorans]